MDFTPFPTAFLPCALDNRVVEGAQAIGVDEAFVAVPLPAAAASASAIGPAHRFCLTGFFMPGGDKTPDTDSASGGFVTTIL